MEAVVPEPGQYPHRRWRWAAFLQRCNNVAQWLSNVLQRWYNVAISCATQHNVVQRDQAMVYLPERCTTLSKRCQTLASVAKPLSNVFQRCLNTWQLAASRWRQAACLQRCTTCARRCPAKVQCCYKLGNAAQRCATLPNQTHNFPNVATCCPNVTRRCSTLPKRLPTLFNVVRTRASSLNLRTFRTLRRRQAAYLQRCNNVAQKLPDIVQRWYNLVVSWATQHNVAQHYLLAARLPQRCHTLPKRLPTLPNCSPTFFNVVRTRVRRQPPSEPAYIWNVSPNATMQSGQLNFAQYTHEDFGLLNSFQL